MDSLISKNNNHIVFVDVDEETFSTLKGDDDDNKISDYHYLFFKDNNFYPSKNITIFENIYLYDDFSFYLIKSKTNDDYDLFFNLVINYFKNINFQPIFNLSKHKNLSFYINNSVDIINPKTFLNIIKLFRSCFISNIYCRRNDDNVDFKKILYKKIIYPINMNKRYACNKKGFFNFNINYVIEVIDGIMDLTNGEYYNIKIDCFDGLIDYGNIIPCKNMLHGYWSSFDGCGCLCGNKNGVLDNFYKIKLKILEYYIRNKNMNVNFGLKSNIVLKDERLEWTGKFLNDINNGIFNLSSYDSIIFVKSWAFIIDGLNILIDIKNNNSLSLKSMDFNIGLLKRVVTSTNKLKITRNNNILVYSKTKQPVYLEDGIPIYYRSHLYFKQRLILKIESYPKYGIYFLKLLNNNNFLFNDVNIEFDHFGYDGDDMNSYYKEFVNFLGNQINIKNLRMSKINDSTNSEYYIIYMCSYLLKSKIQTFHLKLGYLTKSDVDILEHFVLNSSITNAKIICDRLIRSFGALDIGESTFYINKVEKASKIPINKRAMVLKTILSNNSTKKRLRDEDDDDDNNCNNGDDNDNGSGDDNNNNDGDDNGSGDDNNDNINNDGDYDGDNNNDDGDDNNNNDNEMVIV